jgi:hypothetical protein
MTHFRLRTQLFLATLLTIFGLTGGVLFIIRHTIKVETEQQVRDGLRSKATSLSWSKCATARNNRYERFKAWNGRESSKFRGLRRCSRTSLL